MATTTYGTPYVQSSDLVSSYPGTSSTLATRVDDVSLKGNGLNNQTGTSYTLVLTDGGKTVTMSNAAAVTVTIPTNASVAFPTGTIVRFCNLGAGTATIQPNGGVTLNGGNIALAQYAAVQLVKLATDTWGVVDAASSKIAQVVSTTKTDTFTASTQAYVDITGLSVTITPTSSTSTILLLANVDVGVGTDSLIVLRFMRGSTPVGVANTAGNRLVTSAGRFLGTATTGAATHTGVAFNHLDSPATTSATTYKIQIGANNTATLNVNRDSDDSDIINRFRATSSLTAMEVRA